ncbi:MAG: LysM peptidoglycan-binding domain-containing protein [Microbacterium sp.]
MPAALAGSLAVMLSAPPAAAEAAADRSLSLRAVPMVGDHPLVALPRAASSAPETYTVVGGDTVSGIAARFGLRTDDVLALNGLSMSNSLIRPGQVLRLTGASAATPAAAPTPAASGTYVVQAGDTVSAIAQRHGLPIAAVFDANGLDWASIIYPGQKLAIPGSVASAPAPAEPPPAPGGSHVVSAGDTISSIAGAHGVSTQAVLDANSLGWASIIYPGQTLAIPGALVPASVSTPVTAPAASDSPLDAEQTANARLIIQIGRELGVPDRGIAIALGAAMQESWIRNLDWGDRDSLGLFQQRPSTGWGTPDEIRDTNRAVRVFYGGAGDPNGTRTRGLLDIPGWQNLSFADAAQAVQVSAHPDRYAQWEQPAYAWLAALG